MKNKNTANENFIDENKLKYLNKLENIIINTSILDDEISNQNQLKVNLNKKQILYSSETLIEHANYYHDFNINKLSYKEIISLYFIKDHNNSTKTVAVSRINIRDENTLEITRESLNNDFYNEKPYDTEKIIIKRKVGKTAFLALKEDKFKKEAVSIGFDSMLSKSVRFKAFRSPNEMLFLQNIFYYKCILETHQYYKLMKLIPEKKQLTLENLFYHEYIKNLF